MYESGVCATILYDFEQFRKDVLDLDDVEMVLDTESAEEESAQLVVLPECYKKDLFGKLLNLT